MGYSFRLTARVLLYAPSHRQDNIYHGICYTSRGALTGTRNSSMAPHHGGSTRRPIAPWANALTTELHLAPVVNDFLVCLLKYVWRRTLHYMFYVFMCSKYYYCICCWCKLVVRTIAHGAMDRRIDLSWWTHWAISRSNQCSNQCITKAVVCIILSWMVHI